MRAWLYQIATKRCLNVLRSAKWRPTVAWPPPGATPPEPSRTGDPIWLEPFPDALLAGGTGDTTGPEARYEAAEAISLAFLTILQSLPPRQRAVLILRDVLGYRAAEVATMVDTTEESVTSALKRARTAARRRSVTQQWHPPRANSPEERAVVERLTRAYEKGDIDALVAMLTDNVAITMPPVPLEYRGRERPLGSRKPSPSATGVPTGWWKPAPTDGPPSARTSWAIAVARCTPSVYSSSHSLALKLRG